MNNYIRQQNINGHNMQARSPINVLKNVHDLENLDCEIPYSFLRKKAEKLATATYLVTGFLSDSEPLKWQVRECGLSILSDIVSVMDSRVSDIAHRVKNVSSGIEKITSLFEIAATAGFVSDMNLAILKEEYRSLVHMMDSRKIAKPEDGYIFSREFFSTPEPPFSVTDKERFSQNKGHIKKDTDVIAGTDKRQYEEKVFQPNNLSDISKKTVAQKPTEKSSRRDTIIRVIKDKGIGTEVSIKDIVVNFSDCGEKTIQRELTALVAEGVLKKTGDRRWSRYSLRTV